MKSPRDITSVSSSIELGSESSSLELITPTIVSKSLSKMSETVNPVLTTNCLMKFKKLSLASLAVMVLFFCHFPRFPKQQKSNVR